MKPYTLATGLEQGIGVMAIRNGSSPMTFADRPTHPVHNAGNEACAACTLVQAITESLNTVFYGEAYDVGPLKVRALALKAMNLPDVWPSTAGPVADKKSLADPSTGRTDGSIGIGQYEVRPIDQAVGFATFASGGIQRDPYFVAKVTNSEGKVLLTNNGSPGQQVMPADVAHDVTYALEKVAAWSHDALAGGRPSAAKTGTQNKADTLNDNTDSWMVGYTPSISTAVWMGSDGQSAIINAAGRPIYGAGLPGQIWKQFMDTVLQGTPAEQLPSSPIIKGDTGHPSHPTVAPTPTPTPTPTATVTRSSTPATKETTTPSDTATATATVTSTTTATTSSASGIPLPSGPPGHGGTG
jgi:membrane peptidoglycan carboxypeptidase